MDDDEVILN